jgi:drug/metabolite transporter (DMT)-like permease
LVYLSDPDIDAISILAIRFFLALPFFILLLLYIGRNQLPVTFTRSHVVTYLTLGVLGFYVSAILDFSALAYIPAGLERLILFLYPTFVVLISMVVRPKEISRNTIVALLISYAGVVVVFIDQAPQMTSSMTFGALMVFGAAITFAIYTVSSVGPITEHGSVRFTAYAMFAASGATLAHAFGAHGLTVFDKSLEVYLYILPMAVISTVLPLILMAEGVKRIGASSTSIIATTGPVITITLAYLVLGETFGLLQGIGGAMIVAGVFFVSKRKK